MISRPILCRPFIGRREELAYLRERRVEAASSRGQFVFIAGDAGIGKSRLVAEFCESLAYTRWRVAVGSCFEFGNRPFGPILEALARIHEGPIALGRAATKEEQFDSLLERFLAIATRTAVIVVIEDLHWADAATLEFLQHFARRVGHSRILLVATLRPHEMNAGRAAYMLENITRASRASRIELTPLHGRDLTAFIDEALMGCALPNSDRRAIARLSEGNPFFAEELLKSAVEQQARAAFAKRSEAGGDLVPTTIRGTVLERMTELDEQDRRVVAQAAVIGRTFSLRLLAESLETTTESVLGSLYRARSVQLIEEVAPQQFRFRHVLTREAIYGDFFRGDAQARHRAIAESLEHSSENNESLEALSYHWRLAGDTPKTIRYSLLAGNAAALVYAHDDAVAFYERAASMPEIDDAMLGPIVQKIADRQLVMGLNEEARASYARAAEIFRSAKMADEEAACLGRAAMTDYTLSLTDTTAHLVAALERVDASEHVARSRLHLAIAWISAALRMPARAAKHLKMVDRGSAAATDVSVRFHNVASTVAMLNGDVAALRQEHGAWLAAAHARGIGAVAGAYYSGAKLMSALGLHDEAQANIDAALLIARDSRSRHAEECAYATAALCCFARGDLAAGRTAVDRVLPTTDNRVNMTFGAAAGTLIGTYSGDDALVSKWFDGCEATMVDVPELECGAGFAEVMVRRGRARDAADFLHRALPVCDHIRGEVFTLLAIGKYGHPADRRRAREYLARAAVGPNDLVEQPALALFDAYECRRAGPEDEVRRFAREAARGFGRLHYPLLEAEALEVAGETDAAVALYRACGATFHVRRLERNGERTASPNGSATLPTDTLSSREREIASLAANGSTNIEIAQRLGVSHKTVEKHLSSAFRKLEVSSRKALRSML